MVFSSPLFLSVFFPALLLIYFAVPARWRNAVLLGFSLFFYTWGEPKALPVMLLVIAANYWLAAKTQAGSSKAWLICGVALNLGLLGVFKYLDFIILNLDWLARLLRLPELPAPELLLPAGISFYIFQALSYLIDVARGVATPQRSLFRFALYISLFPQLIAGPIVRYLQIERDLGRRKLNLGNIQAGLVRFSVGLGKKVFIADSLGFVADVIFGAPVATMPRAWAWIGAAAYAMQIYYDFSAYSDMAIGIGRVFNFHFPENFNYPYAARSLQDFWRRWHMSLTRWLTDYLYIPLGGSREGEGKTWRNILIVLLCCGIWHGAAWTFILWGLYNGLGLVAERIWAARGAGGRPGGKPGVWARRALTLLFVLVGWVLFRADTPGHAASYLRIMFLGNADYGLWSFARGWDDCLTYSNCLFFLLAAFFSQPWPKITFAAVEGSLAGQLLALALFGAAYAFAMTGDYSPFLYFRF